MALAAGQYVCEEYLEGPVPMRLWVRSSYYRFAPFALVFEWTKAALAYYTEEFQVEFPFSKYDQIFVPEFNMGAMENSGCVMLSDRVIWKDTPTESDQHSMRNMILHELAHMWFGNLVTMQWWDDLWLNESFATYMAYRAEQALGYDSWLRFLNYKTAAYHMDRMPSTHSVRVQVQDTQEAQSNLDSITYGKGSGLVKQLVFLIGHVAFFRGLKSYFVRHAWTNVSFQDFINALQEHCPTINLNVWVDDWVAQPGVNAIMFTQESDNVVITQSCRSGTSFRNHCFDLACYDDRAEVIKVVRVLLPGQIPVIYKLQLPIEASAIIPNPDDHCYFDVVLDRKTLDKLADGTFYSRLPALTRGVVLNSFRGMLENFELSGVAFLRSAFSLLVVEDIEDLLEVLLNTCSQAISYLPYDLIADYSHQLVVCLESKLLASEGASSSFLILLHRRIIGYLFSATDIYNYSEWFHTLRRAEKWRGIMHIATTLNLEDVRILLADELIRDTSDAAVMLRRFCEAAAVDNKQSTWIEITQNWRRYRRSELELMMKGFNRENQREILRDYVDLYFDTAEEALRQGDREYAEGFFTEMFPKCEDPTAMIARLDVISSKEPWVQKMLSEARCQLQAKARGQDLVRRQLAE
jgi:aminopeptidase N